MEIRLSTEKKPIHFPLESHNNQPTLLGEIIRFGVTSVVGVSHFVHWLIFPMNAWGLWWSRWCFWAFTILYHILSVLQIKYIDCSNCIVRWAGISKPRRKCSQWKNHLWFVPVHLHPYVYCLKSDLKFSNTSHSEKSCFLGALELEIWWFH